MGKKAIKPPQSLRLLTDQPVGEFESSRIDGLGFDAYATVLSRAAMGTPGPFTIGVFGEWGTGKTSLMRMIQAKLTPDNVVTVWFNAWQFEKEEHPIVPLVGSILQEIELNKTFRENLKDSGKSLLRALRASPMGFRDPPK
jgi:predicted KAP-like P-loop ATPase